MSDVVSKISEVQVVYFNAIGYETFENVWGTWNGINERDGEALRRAAIERRGELRGAEVPDAAAPEAQAQRREPRHRLQRVVRHIARAQLPARAGAPAAHCRSHDISAISKERGRGKRGSEVSFFL